MSSPVLSYCQTLDDVIRNMNSLRAYFSNPPAAAITTAQVNPAPNRNYLTDAQLRAILALISSSSTSTSTNTTVIIAGPYPDLNGTGKLANIGCRYMGTVLDTDPASSTYGLDMDQWQFEVSTV